MTNHWNISDASPTICGQDAEYRNPRDSRCHQVLASGCLQKPPFFVKEKDTEKWTWPKPFQKSLCRFPYAKLKIATHNISHCMFMHVWFLWIPGTLGCYCYTHLQFPTGLGGHFRAPASCEVLRRGRDDCWKRPRRNLISTVQRSQDSLKCYMEGVPIHVVPCGKLKTSTISPIFEDIQ